MLNNTTSISDTKTKYTEISAQFTEMMLVYFHSCINSRPTEYMYIVKFMSANVGAQTSN